MPRGKPKRGEFDFIIWFEDGARMQWASTKSRTNADIAAAIRRYLVPVMERLEAATSLAAVDPHLQSEGKPSTRDVNSSSHSAVPDKFRKKPIVIDAHRLGDDGWPDAIWEGVNNQQITLFLGRDAAKHTTGFALIHTMEGIMRAEIGDYIIRGVKGEFYPCKPDIFALTYEPASEEPPA